MKIRPESILLRLAASEVSLSPHALAEILGCSVCTVQRRLKGLRADGSIDRKIVWHGQFAHSWVYFIRKQRDGGKHEDEITF